jgi:hypothetical protein
MIVYWNIIEKDSQKVMNSWESKPLKIVYKSKWGSKLSGKSELIVCRVERSVWLGLNAIFSRNGFFEIERNGGNEFLVDFVHFLDVVKIDTIVSLV